MVDLANKTSIPFITGVGRVDKFLAKHKALVKFKDDTLGLGKGEFNALLKTERFAHRGILVNQYEDEVAHIWQFVSVGTEVRFYAHPLDTKDGDERDAQWFIMFGWLLKEEDKLEINYIPGMSNRDCKVSDIDSSGKRKGVLTYDSPQGESVDISFLASKVWTFGRRLDSKIALKTQMHLDEKFYCDAIPTLSMEDDEIAWMATAVWRGGKHVQNTPDLPTSSGDIKCLTQAIKTIALNSKALFVQGRGQVLKIINEDLGLALLHIGLNVFETVLFHRAWVYAMGTCMSNQKLEDFLQEGDPLKMICTASNQGNEKSTFTFKWVACSVHLALENPPE